MNKIKLIDGKKYFKNLKKLKQLYLYSDDIQFIYPNSFDNLVSLDNLVLHYNPFQTLDENLIILVLKEIPANYNINYLKNLRRLFCLNISLSLMRATF